MKSTPLGIVVLISGNGSNLQAIIDAIAQQGIPARIQAVISDQADAHGLIRAQKADIPTTVLSAKGYASREAYDRDLQKVIDCYLPGLVVLAGFMRILSPGFVRHYQGRIINIHPSLLPKYTGLHTHERVLAAGDQEHGVTVHFVTEELDGGPLIAQSKLNITPNDTAETLKTRVHVLEHALYPKVIRWFAENKLRLNNHHVEFDGKQLTLPINK